MYCVCVCVEIDTIPLQFLPRDGSTAGSLMAFSKTTLSIKILIIKILIINILSINILSINILSINILRIRIFSIATLFLHSNKSTPYNYIRC
jgi:hypothetical protein